MTWRRYFGVAALAVGAGFLAFMLEPAACATSKMHPDAGVRPIAGCIAVLLGVMLVPAISTRFL